MAGRDLVARIRFYDCTCLYSRLCLQAFCKKSLSIVRQTRCVHVAHTGCKRKIFVIGLNTLELHQRKKEWILGLAGIAVGTIGAFIESWDLSGSLNHRYPFKIMSVPPPDYYVGVANTIASVAPFFAVAIGAAVLVLLRRYKIIAGIVPVIICPIAYIFGLWYLVSNGPYKDRLFDIVNYDRSSATMRHQEFYTGAINILFFSILVYLTFVLVSYGVSLFVKHGKPTLP